MTVEQLLSLLDRLSRSEQLQILQHLAAELTRSDAELPRSPQPLSSPYDAFRVAEAMMKALAEAEERDRIHSIYKGRFEELQKEIQIGIDQFERGDTVDGAIAMEQLRQELLQRKHGKVKAPFLQGGDETDSTGFSQLSLFSRMGVARSHPIFYSVSTAP